VKSGLRVIVLTASILALAGCTVTGQEPELLPYNAINPVVEEIVSKISAESIAAILQKLETFETRNSLSDTVSDTRGVGAARRWIRDTYESYSPRLEVYLHGFSTPAGSRRMPEGTILKNVVAVLPGTHPELKNKHIILGGHYDSLNLDSVREGDTYDRRDPNRPAPGINDACSGVATAMECARIFSQYEFDKTLIFMAFVAEEQGLIGAGAFARKANAEGMEIEAVLNMDMIGNQVRGGGAETVLNTLRVFSDGPEDSDSRQIARYVEEIGERYVPEINVDLIFRRDRFGRGGDHTAFNREGIAGVRLVEANEDYNRQHSYNDVFENIDMDYLLNNAKIAAATSATLALAPSTPVPGSLGRGEGYDAQLTFSPSQGEVSGYVVAVRATTAPRWEKLIWVGLPEIETDRRGREILRALFPLTDIDNVVFAVGAVGREGCPSLFAAYTR
jgi:Zn-dependent M28 family amino/carboxypeptidase